MPLLGIQLPGEMPPKTDLATNERNKREEKAAQRRHREEKEGNRDRTGPTIVPLASERASEVSE